MDLKPGIALACFWLAACARLPATDGAPTDGCVAREAFEQRYAEQTSRIFALDARGKPHYRQLNRTSALDADLPQRMRATWRCAPRDGR